MARIARADAGPLAPYADGYRELLADLGYTPMGWSASCGSWVGSATG
jgi:hypothetical protein